jgi:molecular chaperone DnaK (HSP70)
LLAIARRAGLPVAEAALVDEPVAAGIAWLTYRFLAHGERPTGSLLVFDMGGGTLDVAVLSVAGWAQPRDRRSGPASVCPWRATRSTWRSPRPGPGDGRPPRST